MTGRSFGLSQLQLLPAVAQLRAGDVPKASVALYEVTLYEDGKSCSFRTQCLGNFPKQEANLIKSCRCTN